MDQTKIGSFLKDLRKERNLTQEQIADKFGVSQRSVSRWENGNTMPDISVLIELADFYDVDLREMLNGKRRDENMDKDMKETLVMVADYTKEEKNKIAKELYILLGVCAVFFLTLGIITIFKLDSRFWFNNAVICSVLGIVYLVMCFIDLLKLTGKIEKTNQKKAVVILVFVCIAAELIINFADLF